MYSILLIGLKETDEVFASNHLLRLGHKVMLAKDVVGAKDMLKAQKIDWAYLQAPSDDKAIEELTQFAADFASLPVVLLCTHPAASLVVEAWHAGAADVIVLPLTSQSLDASFQHGASQLISRELEQAIPARARFRYFDEAGKERWANIAIPRFTIGRSSTNDLILGQMGVSRSHAEVLLHDGEYLLRDLGSKLGTYLNGVKVEQAKLTNGDRVQLGGPQGMVLVFQQSDLLQSLLGISDSKSEISFPIRDFKEIGMLLAAFRALSSISLLDDLLALVVDTAIELTGAERGFIMLKEEGEGLSFRCARNKFRRTLDGSSFQTSRRIPHEVFQKGNRIVIKDLDFGDTSEDHSATRRLGLRSISCVPLRYLALHDSGFLSGTQSSEIIGVLYVDSQNIGAGLSNTQIDALETLASEAAMAIYNARLYKDSQEKRKMEEQLNIARELQQALLPKPEKDLPYVRTRCQNLPCHEVGGDYFDYFDLEEGRFCFALGDVAGKGISAALLASVVQGIFSSQAFLDVPLPAVTSNLNRNLAKRGTGNRFVTFFFGILDPGGNCSYVNAGHNPPVLVHSDGSMKELTEGGMVLGLFPGAQYESCDVQLQPDDHLVLFTDGVIEARDVSGEEFGKERLLALLQANARATATEILTRLRDAVLSFSASAPQHDDITMMVLGYRESKAQSLASGIPGA
jgi:sigma-B regulation protein RsbU (phosphoserine phosphatase)